MRKEFIVKRKPLDTYTFEYYEDGKLTGSEDVFGADRARDTVFYLVGFLGFKKVLKVD